MTARRHVVSWGSWITAAMLLAGCAGVYGPRSEPIGTANLRTATGAPAGTAVLTRSAGDLVLSVDTAGLSPGAHGWHVHTVGRCDPPEFTSAEGHWNPTGRQHGLASANGPHGGDMPNLIADASGRASLQVRLNNQANAAGLAQLFDENGSALIVHAGPDDMRSEPSGNSGARIACGVLVRN